MNIRHNFFSKERICSLLLAVLLSVLCACETQQTSFSPQDFLLNINDLIVDDFGVLTVTEKIDTETQMTQITDHLYLTLVSDPVTNILKQAELILYTDKGLEKLDYATFSYFFLILLKAYSPDITITNINTIHDTLGIETYDIGTDRQIGYGSSIYFYTVTEERICFLAQYNETAEPVKNEK